jgi:hypothetical protein
MFYKLYKLAKKKKNIFVVRTILYIKMSYSNKPDWINWIEEAISKKRIKHYDYKDFSNFKVISDRGFGKVYRANWKNPRNTLALKSLNDSTAEKIVYEVITL